MLVRLRLLSSNPLKIAAHSVYHMFLAHLSRRFRGELIVYRSSRRPSVRAFFLALHSGSQVSIVALWATCFYFDYFYFLLFPDLVLELDLGYNCFSFLSVHI